VAKEYATILVTVWSIWERKTGAFIAHYCSQDDIPDEYMDGDLEYYIQSDPIGVVIENETTK